MRKIISIMALALTLANGAMAQSKFEPQVKATLELGVDKYKNNSAGVELLAGYKVNETLRLGVGTGISWCDLLYEEEAYSTLLNRLKKEYRESASYIPVFVSGKWTLSQGSVSPYINLDLGYVFFNPASKYAEENKMNIFVKPAIGIDFGKGWFAEAGCRYQGRECDHWNGSSNKSIGYIQTSVSLGYHF